MGSRVVVSRGLPDINGIHLLRRAASHLRGHKASSWIPSTATERLTFGSLSPQRPLPPPPPTPPLPSPAEGQVPPRWPGARASSQRAGEQKRASGVSAHERARKLARRLKQRLAAPSLASRAGLRCVPPRKKEKKKNRGSLLMKPQLAELRVSGSSEPSRGRLGKLRGERQDVEAAACLFQTRLCLFDGVPRLGNHSSRQAGIVLPSLPPPLCQTPFSTDGQFCCPRTPANPFSLLETLRRPRALAVSLPFCAASCQAPSLLCEEST